MMEDFPLLVKDSNMTKMEPIISIHYSLPVMIIVAVFLLLLIITTVFGNLLVGLALLKYRQLRTVSNCLIGNLAVSDFLLSTTILPLSAFNECLGYWVFGKALCYFWLCVDVLYCTASIWNLCVIAFDRFTALIYPLWYREKRSTKQTAMYIFFVWILSFAICVPPLLGWNDIQDSYIYDEVKGINKCVHFSTQSYVLYSASGSFFLPFIITTSLYICIFVVIIKRRHSMNVKNHSRLEKRALKEANRGRDSFTLKIPSNNMNTNEVDTNSTEKNNFFENSNDQPNHNDKRKSLDLLAFSKDENGKNSEMLILQNNLSNDVLNQKEENKKISKLTNDLTMCINVKLNLRLPLMT